MPRWPNADDLKRLRSVEGQPQGTVLRVLGHPSAVEWKPDGTEVWRYAWAAACSVSIRNGVCVATFYTAGY